jgi:hypothetical protein
MTKLDEKARAALGGAFRAGYAAERAREVYVEGISWSADMDLALALGWPHLVILGPPSGADDPVARVIERLEARRPSLEPWPSDLAPRAARLLAYGYDSFPTEPSAEALEAAANPDPIDASETAALLGTLFEAPSVAWDHHLVLASLLEAVGDAGALVDATLDSIEAGAEPWRVVDAIGSSFVKHLGFVIARMAPDEAAERRERARAVLARAVEDEPGLLGASNLLLVPARALDLVANGPEAVDRSAYRIEGAVEPNDAVLGGREVFLRVLKAAGSPRPGQLPTAQWVMVGGDEVLDIELARWAEYGSKRDAEDAHRFVLDQFGVFRRPGAVALAVDMAARSAVKGDAEAWLRTHASFAEPIVEQLAKAGPLADHAKRTLAALQAGKPS